MTDRRWRWLPRTILTLGALWMLGMAFVPGDFFIQEQPPNAPTSLENPFGIDALSGVVPNAIQQVLLIAFPLLHLLLLLVCTFTLVQRFIRARGVARQQLTLFTAVVVLLPLIILADRLLPWFPTILAAIYLPLIPVVIGVSLLRDDLLTMEGGSSRLLTWITLLICLGVVYLMLAGALGALFGNSGAAHERGVLVAGGLTVILFQPLRRRIEEGVQRLMYGEQALRYVVLARLGQQLEQAQPLAGDSVLQSMVETLREALNLPWAALSLHPSTPDGTGVEQLPGGEGGAVAAAAVLPLLIERGSAPPEVPRHALPIIYQQEQVGTLHVATPQPREVGATERQLLDDLTRQFGIAIHNLRLLEQTAQLNTDLQRSRERLVLAREEERRRMRRELHDGLAPTLAALNLKAGMIRSRISRDPAAAEALLDDWRSDLRATIADVRRLAYELRPPILDEIGLLAAIHERAHQLMSAHPTLDVRIDAPERLPGLPAAVEVAAYRLVQEALANVERHAQAQNARVYFWLGDVDGVSRDVASQRAVQDDPHANDQENDPHRTSAVGTAAKVNRWLWVEVTDDGIGLPPIGQRRAGVGVLAMRERAEELGGHCTITGGADCAETAAATDAVRRWCGTRVLAAFPVATAEPGGSGGGEVMPRVEADQHGAIPTSPRPMQREDHV